MADSSLGIVGGVAGGIPYDAYGVLANRPSAGTLQDKSLYYATDVLGGTLYQVQSGAWVALSVGQPSAMANGTAKRQLTTSGGMDTTGNTAPTLSNVNASLASTYIYGSNAAFYLRFTNGASTLVASAGSPATLARINFNPAFTNLPIVSGAFIHVGAGIYGDSVTSATGVGLFLSSVTNSSIDIVIVTNMAANFSIGATYIVIGA